MKGTFTATPEDWQFGSSDNNNEYLLVKFRVEPGGEIVYWRGFFTEKTWRRTVESLKHCGWDGQELASLDDMTAQNGMGTSSVELVLDEEEYEGEMRTQVRWVNKIGGQPLKVKAPLEGEAKRRFLARMQARISASSPPTAPKPAGKKQPPPEDDIPF
jgi:hypothetical protein